MTVKTKKIVSLIVLLLPVLLILFSGILKLTGNPMIVGVLTKIGFGSYIQLLGIAEIIFAVLLFFPKTYKAGLLLITAYLGGAASIEISQHEAPIALLLTALIWTGVYIKDRYAFLSQPVFN